MLGGDQRPRNHVQGRMVEFHSCSASNSVVQVGTVQEVAVPFYSYFFLWHLDKSKPQTHLEYFTAKETNHSGGYDLTTSLLI